MIKESDSRTRRASTPSPRSCTGASDQRSFLHLAGANAGRADPNPLSGAVDKRMHRLQIQVPAALTDIMGMTDAMPELRSPTADLTGLCHKTHLHPSLAGLKFYCSRPGVSNASIRHTPVLEVPAIDHRPDSN